MSKASQWNARAEALYEAAEHLKLTWTDNPEEYEQGLIVAARLERESEKARRRSYGYR